MSITEYNVDRQFLRFLEKKEKMNVIKSLYRLFTIIASYQCCLGAPPSDYEIALPSIHVRGYNKTFTNVKLRKSCSPATSCLFDIIFPESEDVTTGPFTPAEAEITFLYDKRIIFGVYKGINSSTTYGLNFATEKSLQTFFVSLRYYQPEAEWYLPATSIFRYSRNTPSDIGVMVHGCEFHIKKFQKPGFTWKTVNFTRVTDDNDRDREGILTFLPMTFTVSRKSLGNTKFAICHDDLPDDVFIVSFPSPSSGQRFAKEVDELQDSRKKFSCEFPNLDEAQKKVITRIHKRR